MAMLLANVQLSNKEYGDLLFSRGIKGGEVKLVRDGNYIIKVFNKNFGHKGYSSDSGEVEEIRENKFRKVEALSSLENGFLDEIKPINTYTYDGKFVAYRMPYLLYPVMSNGDFSKEEQLVNLSKLNDTLLCLHDHEIIYGDIKGDNFFVNPYDGAIIPEDLDNMQVGDYSIDMMDSFASEFVDKYGYTDEKLDSHMHNLYTLETFMDCDMFGYTEVFDRIGIGDIPDGVNKARVKKLMNINSSYDGSYLIDEIRRRY